MSDLSELQPGTPVTYRKTSRGGYGFMVAVRAVVIRKTARGLYTIQLSTGQRVTVTRLSLVVEPLRPTL